MIDRSAAFLASVGKKILMSLTGLVWFGFVIGHMLGNLQLLSDDADPYNQYSHLLISMGALLVLVELILLAGLVIHAWAGISVALGKRRARPEPYQKLRSAGGPSRKSLGSSTMIYTGVLILVFLVIHLVSFKYGPGVEEGYVTQVDGVEMRDLHRLVMEKFSHPLYAGGYAVMMVLLGLHLSHAFWSAFQSLGFYHPRYTPLLYSGGRVLAFLIAFGFFIIPVWIYFREAAQ